MKRSNPSGGKRTQAPNDFKRLKAKVGKRAPQKANATDTKFRTSSVQVRSQSIPDDDHNKSKDGKDGQKKGLNLMEMVTSKGKSLSHLVAQLNHHSPNVKCSSLQGIKDATRNTHVEILPNYLSVLVPSVSKCIVDDDARVRKLAISIFFQDISSKIVSSQASQKMKPFLPLSLAYITSALHSLDQDIRYDGCMSLDSLCTVFRNELNGDREILALFAAIPAFVILFDDAGGGLASVAKRGIGNIETDTRNSSGSKKKPGREDKKKQSSSEKRGVGILRSFISLLKITTASTSHAESNEHSGVINSTDKYLFDSKMTCELSPNGSSLLPSLNSSDLVFLQRGVASNALVWKGNDHCLQKNEGSRNFVLKSINDLSSMASSFEERDLIKENNKSLTLITQIDLLSKLRNRFVEVTQRGVHDDSGLLISSNEVYECTLLISALRFLWNSQPRCFSVSSINEKSKNDVKKFNTLGLGVLNLFLEVLPIRDPSGNRMNQYNFDFLNASLCCAVSEFGSVLDPPQHKSDENDNQVIPSYTTKWVDYIFSYLLPKLKEGYGITETSGSEDVSTRQRNSRVTLLKVIEQLLLRQEVNEVPGMCFLEDRQKQIELLSTFATLYFPSDTKLDTRIARSIEGRKSVVLLLSLISQHFRLPYEDSDEQESDWDQRWKILSTMATALPKYLCIWRGYFDDESAIVLSTLLSIARRTDVNKVKEVHDDSSCMSSTSFQFCDSIRESIVQIFVPSEESSVFETLTSHRTQKLAISLMGLLRYPSETLVTSLSKMCATHGVKQKGDQFQLSDDIIDYIMGVVHSVRDNMSLKKYTEFLLNCTGISAFEIVEEVEGKNDIIFEYDKAITRSCRYLCLAMSEQKELFDVLKPLLLSWLSGNSSDKSQPIRHKLKIRAVITIISCCSLLYTGDTTSSEFILEKDIKENLTDCICNLFLSSSKLIRTGNERFTSPIMTLLITQPTLLCSIFIKCRERVELSNAKDDIETKLIIEGLVFLVTSNSLIETMRTKEVSQIMKDTLQLIEKITSNGPLEMISGALSVQMKAILGFKQ
mmetsp:Transcript_6421/g.7198  ORF Transcript_6421/g.7198 Transcript_6421/m.7198 type:complete len:1054 (-) Transcript_6421:81-3242(-)